MSIYMSKLFPRSNSSFFLRSGNALQAKVSSFRKDMYLVDAGVGPPRIATRDELINVPQSDGPVRFTNRVGYLGAKTRESPVKNQLLERCFVDLVTGDSRSKDRAAVRFGEMVGETEAVGEGGQPLLLPRRYRKKRAWMELCNKYRTNSPVRGFVAEKIRGGYSIGIAGYLFFLPMKQMIQRRSGDRFYIQKINQKSMDMEVAKS